MSKLYNKYIELKEKKTDDIYLFKSGMFYIALEDDALKLSEKLKLKLTNFGNKTLKCGFPQNSLNTYLKLFEENNIKYVIIENTTSDINKTQINKINSKLTNFNSHNSNSKDINSEILYEIANLDINNFTLKDAFDKLYELHIKAKKAIGGI